MVGPLVQHRGVEFLLVPAHRVLGDHRGALPDDQLVDAVVDLGVNMVGTARQHDDVFALLAGFGDDGGALVPDLLHVAGVLVVGGVDGGMDILLPQVGVGFGDGLVEPLVEVLAALQIKVIVEQRNLGQFGAVALQHLGVVGHHRAVVVVVAQVFVQVVAHAGVEHRVHALLGQPMDVTVAELGREAGGIAGDGGLSGLVELAAGEGADHHLEAQFRKQGMPEGQQFIHIQAEGNADPGPGMFRRRGVAVVLQQLKLVGVEVQILVVGLAGDRLVAAVARDEPLAVRKDVDGELAVVAAAVALHGLDGLAEVFQLRLGQYRAVGVFPGAGHAVEGGAVGAHQTGDVGADDLHAHLLLEGAQHRFVVEGAALDHDVAAQFLRAGGADDLVQGVLDDGNGEAGADVLDGGAVLLGLLHRGVHEDGAAAAQVNGTVGEQTQGGKLLHVVAQGLGEGLQEAAAARGTGFVEEDVADGAVLDLEALHVLAADVDDEVHVGHEVLGGGEVGHRLHQTPVTVEGVLDELLAVAGGGDAGDLQPGVVLVQFEQRLPHQRHRVAQVGTVALKQDVGVLVDDHQLDGGGTGIDADMHRAALGAEGQAGHGGFQVPGVEFLVLLLVGKQRRQAHIGGGGAVVVQTAGHFPQVGLLVGIEGGAHGHKEQAVVGAEALDAQRLVEAFPQRLAEGQRPAQVDDVALDGTALGQARDGLVDHGLVDGGSDVAGLGALVDQRLDVALGEDTAAAGDGVGTGGGLGGSVHLVGAHLQKGGHLVDEGAGAAGAAAVHAHLGAIGQEEDLGILTAQLNDAVGAGHQTVGRHAGGEHFLYKGHLAAVGQAHAGGAGNGQVGAAVGQIFGGHFFEQGLALLQNMAEMTLVGGKENLTGVVQHHTFNGRGTNVQTNSHRDVTSCGKTGNCGIRYRNSAVFRAQESQNAYSYRYHITLFYLFSAGLASLAGRKMSWKPQKTPKRHRFSPVPLWCQKKRGVWMKKLGVPASGRVPAPFLRTLTVYRLFVTKR